MPTGRNEAKMKDLELAQEKLKKFNQEEILNVLNKLEGIEKENLIEQIVKLNFEEITNCSERFTTDRLIYIFIVFTIFICG